MSALTTKQQRFVQEYLIDFNGTQAAIRAGYSRKSARAIAQENLTKPDVLDAVDVQRKRLTEESNLKAEQVLAQLTAVCASDVRKLFDAHGRALKPHELDPMTAAAIASIERRGRTFKYRFWSKTEALNLAGRYLKLFKEDSPTEPQAGRYVLLAPATADLDDWTKIIEQHHAREVRETK